MIWTFFVSLVLFVLPAEKAYNSGMTTNIKLSM